jgi:hypothetical protein
MVFHYQLFQEQLTELNIDDQSQTLINAAELIDTNQMTFFGENKLQLRAKPSTVNGVKSEVIEIWPVLRKGLLNLEGRLMVFISYIDLVGRNREDLFNITFRKGYLWEKLDGGEVELKTILQYDTFSYKDQTVEYKFLLDITANYFQHQELKIATISTGNLIKTSDQNVPFLLPETRNELSFYQLHFEGEIPLRQGSPREIAESHTQISNFSYRKALKALMIEGKLIGEIDYWDEDGYLRRETVSYPFWKFIQKNNDWAFNNNHRLVPEIRRFSIIPNNAWPWQRGTVKIDVEIDLIPINEGVIN